jgi:CheY-like chemotaxis protein
MKADRRPVSILVADDDPDDRLLVRQAFAESELPGELHFVEDGEELMGYLKGKEKYTDRVKYPVPGLILLDLNMPRKDGREALKEIKSDPKLRRIPVIVLTTSKAEEDISGSYDLGVNSFISKPVTFSELVDVATALRKYWLEIAELPPNNE